MHYWHQFLAYASLLLEIIGVLVIVLGILWGIFHAIREYFTTKNHRNIYTHIRKEVAYAILLGLEIMIAVDIIKTMDANLSFESLGVLAVAIIIRTILSISLEWEIEWKLPWKKEEKSEKIIEKIVEVEQKKAEK